jgi:hypothetical protein
MRHYQQLLLDSLERHYWTLDEVRKPEHWWAAEIWVISSSRQQFGLRLFVTFIVDPGSERSSDSADVREIAVTRELLADWHADGALVSLRPHSRSYPADIEAAMSGIDELRNALTKAG